MQQRWAIYCNTGHLKWRERLLFTLETRRERRALVVILSSFGVGEQEGWIQLFGGTQKQHQLQTKGVPSFLGRYLA